MYNIFSIYVGIKADFDDRISRGHAVPNMGSEIVKKK